MNLGSENEMIEFKKSTGELKEGVISLSSIINKHNEGTVYFGVKNDGEVVGQDVNEGTLRKISKEISEQIIPKIVPTITVKEFKGKKYIEVKAKGKETPYSAYGRYYIRSFDEDRNLEQHELFEMIIKSNSQDIITLMKSEKQDLTFLGLKSLYIENNIPINENEFETNLGLFTPEGDYNYMAYILSDNNELSIKIVNFNTEDKTQMIRRTDYGNKCLLLSINQVINYIESINETKVEINNYGRIDTPLFDMDAFKEAWMNACLHSRWDKKVPPVIYIYSNRIEIVSCGGLPYNLSYDRFFKGTSVPVNEKLQRIFGQLRYVEQTGHGIPIIVNKYGETAFEIDPNFIIVTIPFSHNTLRELYIDKNSPLNETQTKVKEYISKNPYAKIDEISEKLGISSAYVKRIIGVLKNLKYIERKGSKKIGYWNILK